MSEWISGVIYHQLILILTNPLGGLNKVYQMDSAAFKEGFSMEVVVLWGPRQAE